VVFRVASGEVHGVLGACGHIVAAQRAAGRVEMVEALVKTFLDTDGQGQFTAP